MENDKINAKQTTHTQQQQFSAAPEKVRLCGAIEYLTTFGKILSYTKTCLRRQKLLFDKIYNMK